MNKPITIFTFTLLFVAFHIGFVYAQVKEKEIPKLQNPFSTSFVRDNLSKTKPRMIYNEQIVEQLKGKIKTDPVIENLYKAIRLKAFEILDLPVIERVKTSNSMLNISREILRRVNMLGLVYLVERDKTILERINQEILATSEFSDWNPPVYLDVAEICMAIALALDWTLDDLPESTIKLAKNALIEKGIHPSWEEYGGNVRHAWWVDHYNNWNQVCNGGLIAASVAIADDDPELAARTIKRAMNGIPNVLVENYFPDGVCPEGVMYWDYTTMYALLTLSILETSFGSDFGYREYPGFMESAMFKVMGSNAPSGLLYNYADCKDVPGVDGDIHLAWFAVQTGRSIFFETEKFLVPAEEIRLSYVTGSALAWMCRYEPKSDAEPPAEWVGKGRSPVAIFTGKGENSDYYFGAKGGCGAVSHGNLDAGSFIFELNGVRWSIDPGIQDYMLGESGFDLWRQCQECERWELLTKNNHGHSTITVDDKRHIVDGYALVKKYKLGKKPSVTFDLTPTFKGQLKSAFRKFTKDSERSLLIEDKIKPNESTELVTWQFITQADAVIVNEGVLLNQDGQQLKLNNLSHPGIEFNIVSLDPPPHRFDKQMDNLKRVELRVPASHFRNSSSFHINVRLTEIN